MLKTTTTKTSFKRRLLAAVTIAGIALTATAVSAKIGWERNDDGTVRLKAEMGDATTPAARDLARHPDLTNTTVDDQPLDEEYVADRVIVFFEPESATLTPEAFETLRMFARFVQNTGFSGLEVRGHADTDGSDATGGDSDLSHRRAMTVLTALVNAGLTIDEGKRLSVVVSDREGASADDLLWATTQRRVDVIVRHDTPPFPISDAR